MDSICRFTLTVCFFFFPFFSNMFSCICLTTLKDSAILSFYAMWKCFFSKFCHYWKIIIIIFFFWLSFFCEVICLGLKRNARGQNVENFDIFQDLYLHRLRWYSSMWSLIILFWIEEKVALNIISNWEITLWDFYILRHS